MLFFHSIEAVRIIYITGITNFLFGFIIFTSCRWIPVARLTKGLMKNRFFQKIYKYHAFIWWAFWISVIVHTVFAIGYIGFPF